MDPVTMLIAALSAGAAAAVQETVSDAIKESYRGLKSLIRDRFGDDRVAETTLSQYEADPETWEAPLRKSLEASGSADDEGILDAARHLQGLLAAAGLSVRAQGHRSVAIGGSAANSQIVTGDQNIIDRGE